MYSFRLLLPEQYAQVARDENVLKFPLINAVLSCEQSGKVFVNDFNSFFILHNTGFSLLVSDDHPHIKAAVIELFKNIDIPVYFHLYNPPTWIVDLLTGEGEVFNLRFRTRIQLRNDTLLNLSSDNNEISPYSSEFILERIDEVNFDKLHDLDLDIESKFWDSRDHFLKKGFGVCMLNVTTGRALAICYSAAVVDGIAEIDIKTSADRMNSGLGRIVAIEFLKLSAKQGVTVNWDCFVDNFGSLALAKKVGLKEVFSYPFLSVFNKKK